MRRYLAAAAIAGLLATAACGSHPKMTCAEADQALVQSLPDHIDWTPEEEAGVNQARAVNERACE
jgi:hypothetical protein